MFFSGWDVGDDKLVGGKCSVLPYGTGISIYAFNFELSFFS